MKTELVTTLKRKATDIISSLARSGDPILITQRGRPAAYLVDVETFEALNEKLAVLDDLDAVADHIAAELGVDGFWPEIRD